MYARISWASLKRYEECPMRYKLARERKKKPFKEAWVLRGNVLHYTLEQMVIGQLPGVLLESALRDHDRQVAEAYNLGWGPQEIAESRAKVEVAVGNLIPLYAEVKETYPMLLSELRLLKFYQDWALEGVLDLYSPETESHGALIADLKSGTWESGQLVFYAVLHESYFGRPVEKLLVIEPLGRGLVWVPVVEQEIQEMKDRIMQAVVGIDTDQFPTKGFPDKCSWCISEPWCPATAKTREGRLA